VAIGIKTLFAETNNEIVRKRCIIRDVQREKLSDGRFVADAAG